MDTLNINESYIPGGDIESAFNNLKTKFSGENGLKGQADNMRALIYFKHLKFDIPNPTEEKLLAEICPRYINTNSIEPLVEILDELQRLDQIDGSVVVIL